jgi:hypothetical protein
MESLRHYGGKFRGESGWCPLDEIGFGPRRERRPVSPRLRAIGVGGSIAAAAAVAIAIAVTAAGARHGSPTPVPAVQSAAAIPALAPLSAVCPPVEPTWPDLGALPAGLRPGALKAVVDGQFSGRCPPP